MGAADQKISDLGNEDAILAVATDQRSYAFLVSPAAAGGSSTKVDNIRRDSIEPALRNKDWAGPRPRRPTDWRAWARAWVPAAAGWRRRLAAPRW